MRKGVKRSIKAIIPRQRPITAVKPRGSKIIVPNRKPKQIYPRP